MSALAPIRVRRCDCRYCLRHGLVNWVYVCRLCGYGTPVASWGSAVLQGLRHLRNVHPWPWAPAELDIRDGSEA